MYIYFAMVEARNAQKLKYYLERRGLLHTRAKVHRKNGFIYFPLTRAIDTDIKIAGKPIGIVKIRSQSAAAATTQPDKGYDALGDIAIVEFHEERIKQQKTIAKKLLAANKNLKTILAKAGPISGKYRIRKFKYVAGKRNFIADYRENGCRFRFDVRKTFFSNRLSYERQRIVSQIKPKEHIVVMFAGVGPFAIEIAKAYPHTKVIAIELNKSAYKYMLENIALNKVQNVEPVYGDVKDVAGQFKKFADRIIMPLPKSSSTFLDQAYMVSKKSSIIHLYSFGKSADAEDKLKQAVMRHAKSNNYSARPIFSRVVTEYSATEIEIVMDLMVTK